MWGRKHGVDLLDTPEMGVFFGRLDHLDQGQLMALRAAWHAIPHADHDEAWSAVRAAGAEQGLADEIDRVRGVAVAWTSRGSEIAPYSTVGRPDRMWTQIKVEAAEAIVDAALAFALGSRLDEATRAVLVGPWLAVTENED